MPGMGGRRIIAIFCSHSIRSNGTASMRRSQAHVQIDQRIGRMETKEGNNNPFRALIEFLTTIPGVSAVAAPAILSEIGPDMSRF